MESGNAENLGTEYLVIEDAVEADKFAEMIKALPDIPWHFSDYVAYQEEESACADGYWIHNLYMNDVPQSDFFELFMQPLVPILKRHEYRSLLRARLICYTRTEKVVEHEKHWDFAYPHRGLLLYFNDCNGFTRLHDGTAIYSKANRVLLHDAGQEHNSSTASDAQRRMLLVVNYL